MTTLSGSILLYLETDWQLTGELVAGSIRFIEGWYDREFDRPQVCINELFTPVYSRFTSGGTMIVRYRELFTVNVWQRVPAGATGSDSKQILQNVSDMRHHIGSMLVAGFNLANKYGGSLSTFNTVLPLDNGVPLHEMEKGVPRSVRYEMTVLTTRDQNF